MGATPGCAQGCVGPWGEIYTPSATSETLGPWRPRGSPASLGRTIIALAVIVPQETAAAAAAAVVTHGPPVLPRCQDHYKYWGAGRWFNSFNPHGSPFRGIHRLL